jgi:replicative DNA helicase
METKKTRKPKTLAEKWERQPGAIDHLKHGRVPPQAIDLEEAVLGAVLLEQNALNSIVEFFEPEFFYKESHQLIYKAVKKLFSQSLPVDMLTVVQELKTVGDLELAGGAYYISQLSNRVASAANIEYHARIVQQKYLQRELISISSEVIKHSYEDTSDVFDILDFAERNLFAVSETNLRRNYNKMVDLVKDALDEIEKATKQEGNVSGVPSGFSGLDRMTAGWQKSDLIVLAARPGMGKTAFMLTMARNIAVESKMPIAVFSLEMTGVQLVKRLISSESMLTGDKLRRGDLNQVEFQQLNARISSLTDAPIFIDDTPALGIFDLRAKARRLKSQHNIQMLIIDYLQLMSGGSDHRGNREQEISNISRSLKSLAKELNIPILALSQLSRAVETRGGNKRPQLSDLRESGAIEQDADMVLFIYRPEYYKITQDEQGNSTQGLAQLIIAKHRNGSIGDVNLFFHDQYAKFSDYSNADFQFAENLEPSKKFDGGASTMTFQSKLNDDEPDDAPPF